MLRATPGNAAMIAQRLGAFTNDRTAAFDASEIVGSSPSGLESALTLLTQDIVATSNLVEVENVTFSYDRRQILKNIDLVVPRGKVVAIMGLSGCGKTTLLRLIGGALAPDSGEVRVAGKVVNKLSDDELFALRRRMGMLFQFGALFTDASSFDNVAFQMREHTRLPEPLIRDLALMKLQAVGLRGAADLMPSELSGGMARRVALARSIALDPMLMLYDEPFTGLDPISLGVIGQLILQLNDALGATSIIVTHDVAEALELVDYVYYMAAGKVEFHGTPAQVRAAALPSLRQFVYGETDGPVAFHFPAPEYAQDLLAQ
jgi:phospholipid/cholesterol/gamma-HCH transport system ATP-binding protein